MEQSLEQEGEAETWCFLVGSQQMGQWGAGKTLRTELTGIAKRTLREYERERDLTMTTLRLGDECHPFRS